MVRPQQEASRSGAAEALAGVPLLAGLAPDALAELARRTRPVQRGRGEQLVRQGDPGGALLVLLRGSVTVYRTAPGGARAALRHLTAPAHVGEVTLLDGSPRTASVEVVTAVTALELSRQDLLDVVGSSPALLDGLLAALGALVRRLSVQASDAVLLDLPGRVAKTLLATCSRSRPPVVRLDQGRLAELAGGSRQTVNAVLHGFAERGLVSLEGRELLLTDVEGLRRRAGLAAPTGGGR